MVFWLVKTKTVVHGSDWRFHEGVLRTDIPTTMQDSKEQSGDKGKEERERERGEAISWEAIKLLGILLIIKSNIQFNSVIHAPELSDSVRKLCKLHLSF